MNKEPWHVVLLSHNPLSYFWSLERINLDQVRVSVMDCPTCSKSIELYSLEYSWCNDVMEPRPWYYCLSCHEIWIMNAGKLVKAQEGHENLTTVIGT
jgi:hypothetical protein